jgi:ATPase subunit of ABC transporter with duplicated ATPase domains
MKTRKYMNGKRRRVSPLRQDDEIQVLPGSAHSLKETKESLRKTFETKKQVENRKLQHIKDLIKTKKANPKKDWTKEAKERIKQTYPTDKKTIHTPRLPLGGVIGMMLIPKSVGKGSNVIDPKTGKNKYTGKTEYTPF